jgi:hypothetical protein
MNGPARMRAVSDAWSNRHAQPGSFMQRDEIERWLEELRIEHRDLDEVITHLIEARHTDSMRIQRLKKRKLKLKDMIARLESELIPDLDA